MYVLSILYIIRSHKVSSIIKKFFAKNFIQNSLTEWNVFKIFWRFSLHIIGDLVSGSVSAHQHALVFIVTNYPHFKVAVFVGFFALNKNFCGRCHLHNRCYFQFCAYRAKNSECVCVGNFFVFKTIHMLEMMGKNGGANKKLTMKDSNLKSFFRNFHEFQREIVLMRQREHAK